LIVNVTLFDDVLVVSCFRADVAGVSGEFLILLGSIHVCRSSCDTDILPFEVA
jgi:hypothetical protein